MTKAVKILWPGLVAVNPETGLVITGWVFGSDDPEDSVVDIGEPLQQREVAIAVLRFLVERAGLCPEDLVPTPSAEAMSAAQAVLEAARRPR